MRGSKNPFNTIQQTLISFKKRKEKKIEFLKILSENLPLKHEIYQFFLKNWIFLRPNSRNYFQFYVGNIYDCIFGKIYDPYFNCPTIFGKISENFFHCQAVTINKIKKQRYRLKIIPSKSVEFYGISYILFDFYLPYSIDKI